MSVVINGVTCEELVANFGEGADSGGLHAQKSFLCDWNDRYAVANGLMGLTTVIGGIGGAISIQAPARYAESSNLFARQISISGVGKPTAGALQIRYEKAVVGVSYGNFSNSQDDPYRLHSIDPNSSFIFCEQELDLASEFYTLEGVAVQFEDGEALNNANYGIPIGVAALSITLHRVPFLDADTVFSHVGHLNTEPFLKAAPGHLRFNGAKTRKVSSTDGSWTQDISYSFSLRGVAPWDYGMKRNGTWAKIVTTIGGNDTYEYSDLREIIPSYYRY